MIKSLVARMATLTVVAIASVLIAACGDDGTVQAGSEETAAKGNSFDRGFATAMVPHHESAVEMAKFAQERGEHQEIRKLADDIIRTQSAEIDTLRKLDQRLESAGVETEALAMEEHEMGMTGDAKTLATAVPFDREFIDMMIPHHQGAIRMAREEQAKGADPEAKRLADEIINAQAREIEQMNAWRKQWYGAASPTGGVPKTEATSSEDSEKHPAGHSG